MRRLIVLAAAAMLVPAAVMAQQVQYDLGAEGGYFQVRIEQEFAGPVPALVVVGSEHPRTEFTAFHGQVSGAGIEFPVGRWSRGQGMQADLRQLVTAAGGQGLAIEWGADYFDLDCLQVRDGHLLFRRTTNLDLVRIALPAGYGLLFCNQAARVEYEGDRVSLVIENPDHRRLEIDLVASLVAIE